MGIAMEEDRMLKIRRFEEEGLAVFALIGRIDRERVPEVRNVLTAERDIGHVKLDLEELRLVDRDAVKFLDACEVCGIQLTNCPPYIREWIETGRSKL
jgi:hypothetical protein